MLLVLGLCGLRDRKGATVLRGAANFMFSAFGHQMVLQSFVPKPVVTKRNRKHQTCPIRVL